jgi:hypothetical protein
MQYRLISGLDFVAPIKGQGRAARPVRMRADPRIFIGESPHLNRCTARILQARRHHGPINVSLALQIFRRSITGSIDRQRNVKFRNVNLQAQRGQACNIRAHGSGVKIELRNMQLQPDAVDRNSALLEIFDHGINSIRLAVHPLALRLVVEKQSVRIGLVCPAKGLFHVGRAFSRESNSRLVVPRRVAPCCHY